MADVLQLVQTALDTVLAADGVRVYWGRRGEIDSGANKKEYVVYSQDNDSVTESADGGTLARTASIAVRYYIEQNACRTYAGRTSWKTRADVVLQAMTSAGFLCPTGWVEIGDVDDVGFVVFLAIFDYARIEAV